MRFVKSWATGCRPEIADDYLQACKAYRIDECMGDYKPFHQIVADSMERASRRVGLEFTAADAQAVYDKVPSFGPYPGVTEALNRLAEELPLVIITNSDTAQAVRLAENLRPRSRSSLPPSRWACTSRGLVPSSTCSKSSA